MMRSHWELVKKEFFQLAGDKVGSLSPASPYDLATTVSSSLTFCSLGTIA